MVRRRRNKRKRKASNTGNPNPVGGRAVKVKRRGNKACTTENQKGIE